MVLKILLADDEPSALQFLKNVAESSGDGFEVVYCASNGAEALEQALLLQPDILITDVRMPIIDGLGLVEQIGSVCPKISSIIVSGYQDFEYAKQALHFGVVDYLLKPLDIDAMHALLWKIRKSKLEIQYQISREQLSELIARHSGHELDMDLLLRYLPPQGYRIALIRIGALPSRFSRKQAATWRDPAKGNELFVDPYQNQYAWILEGRDDAEFFIIHVAGNGLPDLREMVQKILGRFASHNYTVLLSDDPLSLTENRNRCLAMQNMLDHRLILGFNQILNFEKSDQEPQDQKSGIDNMIQNRIAQMISGFLYEELKLEMINLFGQWEAGRYSQLWVEFQVRQIMNIIVHNTPAQTPADFNLDLQLDEAYAYSRTMGELMVNIWQIILDLTPQRTNKVFRIDTEDFWETIHDYIQKNLRQPMTLGSVCDYLGISQTYLSRLFRKYANLTFNEYITLKRMDEARKLILQSRNKPIQDIALAVGYDNPSYFSKVFKKTIGIAPSDFAAMPMEQVDG